MDPEDDDFLFKLTEALQELNKSTDDDVHVVNPMQEVYTKAVYDVLVNAVGGENVSISRSHELYVDDAACYVTVEGPEICVFNPRLFSKAARLTDKLSMFPDYNGDMSIQFYFGKFIQ